MDVAQSTQQGAHYHANGIYLLTKSGIKTEHLVDGTLS